MTKEKAEQLREKLYVETKLSGRVYPLDEYYIIFIGFIGQHEGYAKKTEEIVLLAGDEWKVTGMVICNDYGILITPK